VGHCIQLGLGEVALQEDMHGQPKLLTPQLSSLGFSPDAVPTRKTQPKKADKGRDGNPPFTHWKRLGLEDA